MPTIAQAICMFLGLISLVILSKGFYRAYTSELKRRKASKGAYLRSMTPEQRQAWLDDLHKRVDARLERYKRQEEENRKKQEQKRLERLKELQNENNLIGK